MSYHAVLRLRDRTHAVEEVQGDWDDYRRAKSTENKQVVCILQEPVKALALGNRLTQVLTR